MAIFVNLSPTSSHFHPLQVENCDSDSRLVVDEDDTGKFRLGRVNIRPPPSATLTQHLTIHWTNFWCLLGRSHPSTHQYNVGPMLDRCVMSAGMVIQSAPLLLQSAQDLNNVKTKRLIRSKREKLIQCWFNVWSASQTVA